MPAELSVFSHGVTKQLHSMHLINLNRSSLEKSLFACRVGKKAIFVVLIIYHKFFTQLWLWVRWEMSQKGPYKGKASAVRCWLSTFNTLPTSTWKSQVKGRLISAKCALYWYCEDLCGFGTVQSSDPGSR